MGVSQAAVDVTRPATTSHTRALASRRVHIGTCAASHAGVLKSPSGWLAPVQSQHLSTETSVLFAVVKSVGEPPSPFFLPLSFSKRVPGRAVPWGR